MNRNKNLQRRHHNNGKRRAKNKASDESAAGGGGGGDMDDIMTQLQLQRQRQRQKQQKDTDVAAADVEVNDHKKSKKKRSDATAAPRQEIGDFRFDSISKRYLPKTSFNNKPDKNAQQKQSKNVSIDRLRWTKRHSISDEDVRRVIFRGSALLDSSLSLPNTQAQKKTKKKRHDDNDSFLQQQIDQQIPCSERIVQLLTTSLQYANNSHKRNAIANILGPITIARGVKVVPSAVSEDMSSYTKSRKSKQDCSLTDNCHSPVPQQQTTTAKSSATTSSQNIFNRSWYSLLHPIIPSRQVILNLGLSPPYDCVCKTYLPPTASTFDIQSHPNSIPSVVTFANGELFCRQNVSIPSEGLRAFRSDDPPNYNIAGELPIYDLVGLRQGNRKHQCVRFAPQANHIGILSHDSSMNYYFAFKNIVARNVRPNVFSGLDGQVNDFCLSRNRTVAFVHGTDSESGVSYLDLTNGGYLQFPKYRSEALSIQYLGDQLLCGHRDGSVSLHDRRGSLGYQVSTPAITANGSSTSIYTLRDGNSVVVKGSFGSCRVLDVRKLQNSNSGSSSTATLRNLCIPTSLVHKTKSTRCTGVAIDPTESIVISPYAGQNSVSFALWCMKSGTFLRSIDLGMKDNDTQLPPFCELSSKTTPGVSIKQSRGSTGPQIAIESNFGIWFKSGPMNPSSPPTCGGIHHLSFPK